MRAWRQDIHKHPELGFDENRTAAKIAELLREFGLEVHTGIGGTGVVGVLKRGTCERAMGLRADMDALPIQEQGAPHYKSIHNGVFHGCGHDGHSAMLLGAARYLSLQGDFDGTVYFIFQPNEENGLGALAMINDGLFDRFAMESIYGIHNMPGIATGNFAVRKGEMMAFEDNFVIQLKGVGGHASMPHKTIDPMVVGAEIISALQTIVSRSIGAEQWAVVSVTEFITDGARNIIPSNVTIKGDTRGLDTDVQVKIEERMRKIVEGICGAYGVENTVEYTHEFIVLHNSVLETNAAIKAARSTVGMQRVEPKCDTFSCSEDFAQFLKYVPGCYILIGNGDSADDAGLHNPYYDFKDDILNVGASYWVNLVCLQLAPQ